jgi:hypothetical protein
MGVDFIRCRDAYNGHVLWETRLPNVGRPYRDPHYSGTYTQGSNWCLGAGELFVHDRKECFVLDAATGAIVRRIAAGEAAGGAWGFIACRDGILFGTEEGEAFVMPAEWMHQFYDKRRTQGKRLFAVDPATGKTLWSHAPRHSVIRDSIAIGGGKVFFIDGLVPDRVGPNRQDEIPRPAVVALDAETGQPQWQSDGPVYGTMLAVSEKHDVLVSAYAGQGMRGLTSDLGTGMAAYRASTGEKLWDDDSLRYNVRPVVVDDTIISQHAVPRQRSFLPSAWDLKTGKLKLRRNPVSGTLEPWAFGTLIRCGLFAASENLMVFRAWETVSVDLTQDQGFTIVKGLRVGCWLSAIPAGGMVLLPNNVPYCYCSFMHRTAMGLAAEEGLQERWGLYNARQPEPGTIRHVGLNFGAPGDRRDSGGVLWLAFPRPYSRHESHVYGKLLRLGKSIALSGAAEPYRHNADRIAKGGTDVPWIAASGICGQARLALDVSQMPPDSRYRLRLIFAEPQDVEPGERVFSVLVDGEEILKDFDVFQEAGNKHVAVTRELTVTARGKLEIGLIPKTGEPLISGIEIQPIGQFRQTSD